MTPFKKCVFCILIILCCDAKLKWSSRLFKRITRGVGPENLQFYEFNKEFKCLNSDGMIPYSWVNDDYCDCMDGSDEPGTAACPNYIFHCNNVGFKPHYILSSRVNDGVCDCCDGSDEYSQHVACHDICQLLGEDLRRKEEEERRSLEEGHEKYLEYCRRSARLREEKEAEFTVLNAEFKVMKDLISDLQKVVEDEEKIVEELKNLAGKRANEELDKKYALEAFQLIDTNEDARVDAVELETFLKQEAFEVDEIDPEDQSLPADFDNFLELVWPEFKDAYKIRQQEHQSNDEGDDDDDNTEGSYDNDSDNDDDDGGDDDPDQIYDDETSIAIERARESREKLDAHKSKLDELTKKMAESVTIMIVDGGKNNEYLPLIGQCFGYEDATYIYTLCPLVKVTQKFKDLSGDFNLGRWDSWIGRDENKYSAMYYKDGSECWDAPNRSTVVMLECGNTEEITSVSEHIRCEYTITFKTPASCPTPPPSSPSQHHDPSDL